MKYTIKKTFLFILFVISFFTNLYSQQDTLVFKTGKVKAIDILDVDLNRAIIKYSTSSNEGIVSIFSLDKYYYQSKWTYVDGKKMRNTENESLKTWSYLEERSGFSIGTNISSALIGALANKGSGLLLSERPLITLEPEFRFKSDKFSVKGCLSFGLPILPKTVFEARMETYQGAQVNSALNDNGLITYNGPTTFYIKSQYYNNRLRYIPFESGASFVFWPVEFLRDRFFISIGIMVGVMDYYTVEIYDTFEQTYQNGWPIFNITDQEVLIDNNPFFYSRIELGLGYNFQLGSRFSLGLDLTLTNVSENKGSKSDKVFSRIDDEPYELIYNQDYAPTNTMTDLNLLNSLFLRFKAHYHFTN